ncbi:MAG: hypothetical protein DSY42_01850 [Aquifex sp.]|nr:MAG: hypothetical protein DSY42_01850 [Aquifex sp.]
MEKVLVRFEQNQNSFLSINDYQEVISRISDGLEILQRAKREIKRKLKKGIHYDKPFKGAKQDILTKAGADQLAYLTGIEVVERKDEEIRDRNGNVIGFKVTLKLRSKLLNKEVISSRICSKDEKKAKDWSMDMLLAMAFKRAWVYGVIQLTGLSDMFIDEEKADIQVNDSRPATEKQKAFIKDLLRKRNIDEREFERKFGKIEDLSSQKASEIINILQNS